MILYACPVCAYPEMDEPVHEGNICPCCGTEFGYDDDLDVTYHQLRLMWIERGTPWFSQAIAPPRGWDPFVQLLEGGFSDFDYPDDDTTNDVSDMHVELVA